MRLSHIDWKQLSARERFLGILDDASRYETAYGVFRDAITENTPTALKEAMTSYGCPDGTLNRLRLTVLPQRG